MNPKRDDARSFKYKSIALGGTFDQIHKGHAALLERAFSTGETVVIGLTSDKYIHEHGKEIDHSFGFRKAQLERYLRSRYPGRSFVIRELDATFGPGMYTRRIEAIAVSSETLSSVEAANSKRKDLGIAPLAVEVVPMVLAEDSRRISSTRIRKGEIDEEGRLQSREPK